MYGQIQLFNRWKKIVFAAVVADRSGFIFLYMLARSLGLQFDATLQKKCKHKKCTRFFLALASGIVFQSYYFHFFSYKALKYLPSDDVNINDQFIGVDQRIFEDALQASARNLWGQFIVRYLKAFPGTRQQKRDQRNSRRSVE